jgi:hypothetical protein
MKKNILFSITNYKTFWNILVLTFDSILFILVLYLFFNHLLMIVSNISEVINNLYNIDNICKPMNMNPSTGSSSGTTTQILHTSEGWGSAIKSIFIYGTGAVRYQLIRAGTPLQKGFVIGSTILADAASTTLKNAMNDPEYVEKHWNSWTRMRSGVNNSTLELNVDKDNETLSKLKEVKNKLLPDNIDTDYILDYIISHLKVIIEPVPVEYSSQLLANQIYGISIILFILSILILILLLAFMINIVILVYSDKLMNFFSNKYIRWYIALNKKLIGIEICFLGGSLIYFMYTLSYGIHFIATHPIIIN